MPETCGCKSNDNRQATQRGDEHAHDERSQPDSLSAHGVRESVQVHVLARNWALAARNRLLLQAQRAFAVHLRSSPGAGRTTL